MIYRPRFFEARELVDPDTFGRLGDGALMLFRPEALRMLDDLREFLGAPLVVNDWHRGGTFRDSGFRSRASSVGAPFSAHRVGAAFDVKPKGMTVAAAWAKIAGAPGDSRVARIRRVEDPAKTVTWLHVDCYEHDATGIRVVEP